MRIWLDPNRLYAHQLTAVDVIEAIRIENAEVSAGQIGGLPATPGQEIAASIIAQTRMNTAEEFGGILLRVQADGSQVRLRDVARGIGRASCRERVCQSG